MKPETLVSVEPKTPESISGFAKALIEAHEQDMKMIDQCSKVFEGIENVTRAMQIELDLYKRGMRGEGPDDGNGKPGD